MRTKREETFNTLTSKNLLVYFLLLLELLEVVEDLVLFGEAVLRLVVERLLLIVGVEVRIGAVLLITRGAVTRLLVSCFGFEGVTIRGVKFFSNFFGSRLRVAGTLCSVFFFLTLLILGFSVSASPKILLRLTLRIFFPSIVFSSSAFALVNLLNVRALLLVTHGE